MLLLLGKLWGKPSVLKASLAWTLGYLEVMWQLNCDGIYVEIVMALDECIT